MRSRNRLVDEVRVGLRKFAKHDVAVDRATRIGHRPFSSIPPSNERRPWLAEQPILSFRNDRIQMCVNAGKIFPGV
jgi:hypothetical protein